MSMAWFMYPISFESSRDFECSDLGDVTTEQCDYYQEFWHFWYVSDLAFANSTVYFMVTTLGIFFLGRWLNALIKSTKFANNTALQRLRAGYRYLSYRGFTIKSLKWNSAPLGILLLGAVGFIFFLLMTVVPQPYYWPDLVFGYSPPLGTRAGWMALALMPFVFATASKANWITLFMGISHERLQVFHRWLAYAFFVLALVHTFPFIIYHTYYFNDIWVEVTQNSVFIYWTGILAVIVQAWLTFASHSTFRNMNYEFFKIMHFAAVIIFVIVFFWHCGGTLTSWDYFVATAAVYVPSLVYPWIRTIFEYGIGQEATLHLEDNDFIRITIPSKSHWLPGQHCFLRFTGLGLHALTIHPFTICSVPDDGELVFYIRKHRGITAKLHSIAASSPGRKMSVLVDGPYGGCSASQILYQQRIVVIAGGSGAGWALPLIDFFARYNNFQSGEQAAEQFVEHAKDGGEKALSTSTQALPSIRVIIATRHIATNNWFQNALQTMLARHSKAESVNIEVEIHLTGQAEQAVQDSQSNSDAEIEKTSSGPSYHKTDDMSIDQCRGRPHLPQIIASEAQHAANNGQNLGVYVCGPGEMQNDVRNAVAKQNLAIFKGVKAPEVYLHTEHFEWA